MFKLDALAAIAMEEDGVSKEREDRVGQDVMEVFPSLDGGPRI